MSNADTITDEQITALRDEARAAGDTAMVQICFLALDGADPARAQCAEAIASAAAMDDDGEYDDE